MKKIVVNEDELIKLLNKSIDEYTYIENNITGLEYQQRAYYVMGQISMITAILGLNYDKEEYSSYYEYIDTLTEKINLDIEYKLKESNKKYKVKNKYDIISFPIVKILFVLAFMCGILVYFLIK